MRQVSGDQLVDGAMVVDGAVELVEGGAEPGGGWDGGGDDLGQAGAEEAGVGASEEERGAASVRGELVAVGPWEPLDQAVEAESAEVVGHPARGELAGSEAQQWREQFAQVAVGEPRGQEAEDDQRREERLDALLLEAERGGALAVDRDGLGDLRERRLTEMAIVADPLAPSCVGAG